MTDTQKPEFWCSKGGQHSIDVQFEPSMDWATEEPAAQDRGGDRPDVLSFVFEFIDTTEHGSHCPTKRYFASQGDHHRGIISRVIGNDGEFCRDR